MNYTKTLREYCKTTPWKIFDVSYEMSERFKMVPYKTLLKALNRLEEEGLLETISKGVYLIKTGEPVEDPILAHYASEGRGVVVGYAMYNRYGITDHTEKPIRVYTNAMETETKNIGKEYVLMRLPIFFTDSVKNLIAALEILENGPEIIGQELSMRANALMQLLRNYKDPSLTYILRFHPYPYSTICSLDSILSDLKIQNEVLNIYRKECQDA